MSESQPDNAPADPTPANPTSEDPTSKQLRDARRHAHGVQKDSKPEQGGDEKGRKGEGGSKGRKGKGDPKP